MLERREACQDPTTQIRRQMVFENCTPLPWPKSLSGLGHYYAHLTELAPNVRIFHIP